MNNTYTREKYLNVRSHKVFVGKLFRNVNCHFVSDGQRGWLFCTEGDV